MKSIAAATAKCKDILSKPWNFKKIKKYVKVSVSTKGFHCRYRWLFVRHYLMVGL